MITGGPPRSYSFLSLKLPSAPCTVLLVCVTQSLQITTIYMHIYNIYIYIYLPTYRLPIYLSTYLPGNLSILSYLILPYLETCVYIASVFAFYVQYVRTVYIYMSAIWRKCTVWFWKGSSYPLTNRGVIKKAQMVNPMGKGLQRHIHHVNPIVIPIISIISIISLWF